MKTLFSGIALLAALSVGAWAAAPAPLTEGEALRLGLSRPAIADVARGTLGLAEAEATEAGLLPNPRLDYQRDRTGGSVEQTAHVSQTFDIAGKRGLQYQAAERRVQAVRGSIEAHRLDVAAELRHRFHEVLFRQNLQQAVAAWRGRIGHIEGTVAKLERGGEASGYDRRRLSRERLAAQAHLEAEGAELERAREQLSALLGRDAELAEGRPVAGNLLPAVTPALDTLLPQLQSRPALKALEARAAAADLEGRAASRGWIPDITVGIGSKRIVEGPIHDSGVSLSLSIPLPVFDHQQAGSQRAASRALVERGEYALALARSEGDLRGLWKQAERLRDAAASFRAQSLAASADLTRIAEAAYRGGESSLLELLDAYKGALEADTMALELEWKARQSRIELDQLTGALAP